MEYKAIARHADQTYYGHIFNNDGAAVNSVVEMLPPRVNPANVALIVHRVYSGNVQDIAYVSTLAKYLVDTE